MHDILTPWALFLSVRDYCESVTRDGEILACLRHCHWETDLAPAYRGGEPYRNGEVDAVVNRGRGCGRHAV